MYFLIPCEYYVSKAIRPYSVVNMTIDKICAVHAVWSFYNNADNRPLKNELVIVFMWFGLFTKKILVCLWTSNVNFRLLSASDHVPWWFLTPSWHLKYFQEASSDTFFGNFMRPLKLMSCFSFLAENSASLHQNAINSDIWSWQLLPYIKATHLIIKK